MQIYLTNSYIYIYIYRNILCIMHVYAEIMYYACAMLLARCNVCIVVRRLISVRYKNCFYVWYLLASFSRLILTYKFIDMISYFCVTDTMLWAFYIMQTKHNNHTPEYQKKLSRNISMKIEHTMHHTHCLEENSKLFSPHYAWYVTEAYIRVNTVGLTQY